MDRKAYKYARQAPWADLYEALIAMVIATYLLLQATRKLSFTLASAMAARMFPQDLFRDLSKRSALVSEDAATDLARHVVLMAVSLALLPLDTAILVTSFGLAYLPFSSKEAKRRRKALRDALFQQRTILITGIETPRGLALARKLYYAGHRVIGGDVGPLPVWSGSSMSKTLSAFYRIPKTQYVSTLLDVVKREKVDLWIPCSDVPSAMEDAVAKEVIESRTNCKCIHFDSDFTTLFSQAETFAQFLTEKGLPVAEKHDVRSRDSIHKILNRSPTKLYHMRKAKGPANDVMVLPKRTLSQTYSDVSEIKISANEPWILQQQARLGEYYADMILIRGQIKAFKLRPANGGAKLGESRLDEGLCVAVHNLMQSLAEKGGTRMTGHLSVKVMVDEEIGTNSVRNVVYIVDCMQGTEAVSSLLEDSSSDVVPAYLTALSPDYNSIETTQAAKGLLGSRRKKAFLAKALDACLAKLKPLRRASKAFDALVEQAEHLLIWKNPWFSRLDPLPWWWEVHVFRPLKDLVQAFIRRREEALKEAACWV